MQSANRVYNSWGVLYIATNLAFVLVTLMYRETSSIKRTKSPNLNISRLFFQLSMPNPLKPGIKVDRA